MSFIQSVIKNTREITMQNKADSLVTTSGYLYDLTTGVLAAASASSTRDTLVGVSNQTIAAAEALTQCPVITLAEGDTWLVDSTNNSDVAHNGQAMIVGANAGVINNTGTTSAVGVVVQVGTFGVASAKKILVRFIR